MQANYQDICLVRSPAKVILCGEHAVVYGKDAIAIGITLYCTARLRKRNRINHSAITIKSSIQQDIVVIDTHILKHIQSKHSDLHKYNYQEFEIEIGTTINSHFCKSIHYKLSLLLKQWDIDWIKWSQSSPSQYLIDVSSQIPIGRCLGSSAAFNTVLTAAFLVIFHQIQKGSENTVQAKEKINNISILMQSVEHGNPSGIDNYVSVNGGIILYNKTKTPRFLDLKQSLKSLKEFVRLAIIDSGVDKNTKVAVCKVRQKYDSSEVYKQKIQQIGCIVEQIKQILEDYHCNKQSINRVLTLTTYNHRLLRDLQVSHEKIEEIVIRWQKMDWSAKITGSGMGGCVLLLSHKESSVEDEALTLVEIDEQGIKISFTCQ